eukprot:scaffold5586_cov124-Isochrysis_galbana.AAC.7
MGTSVPVYHQFSVASRHIHEYFEIDLQAFSKPRSYAPGRVSAIYAHSSFPVKFLTKVLVMSPNLSARGANGMAG